VSVGIALQSLSFAVFLPNLGQFIANHLCENNLENILKNIFKVLNSTDNEDDMMMILIGNNVLFARIIKSKSTFFTFSSLVSSRRLLCRPLVTSLKEPQSPALRRTQDHRRKRGL